MARQDRRQPRNKGGRQNEGKGFPIRKPVTKKSEIPETRRCSVLSYEKFGLLAITAEIMLEQKRSCMATDKNLESFIQKMVRKYGAKKDRSDWPYLIKGMVALFFLVALEPEMMADVGYQLLREQIIKSGNKIPLKESVLDKLAKPICQFSATQVRQEYERISEGLYDQGS